MVLRGGESRVLGSDGEKAVVFGGSRWLEMGNARWGFFPFRYWLVTMPGCCCSRVGVDQADHGFCSP
ncbi:hypothetical protein V6N11_047129 [Hibiscus sabdariffa]|uniref:Uncharacterized protein n=1 Tax=Hibiscus sabdariffa TaxID=183260 RepID=A0ABR1Z8V2_9ROSI